MKFIIEYSNKIRTEDRKRLEDVAEILYEEEGKKEYYKEIHSLADIMKLQESVNLSLLIEDTREDSKARKKFGIEKKMILSENLL